MAEIITFRAHLLGSLTDFSSECKLGDISTPSFLVDLVVLLSRYAEEGTKYHPEVFLFNDVDAVLKLIPGNTKIPIGKSKLTSSSIHLALKKCAALAIGGWHVYIEQIDSESRYGIFHGAPSPLALSVSETIFSGTATGIKVVHIHQVAEDCVELCNSAGNKHVVFLSHKRDSEPSPKKNLEDLVTAICKNVTSRRQDQTRTYLLKAISNGLRLSHGALVAVSSKTKQPQFLRDGVVLERPIAIPQLIIDIEDKRKSEIELISISSLIRGMLSSDGIVLFDNKGRLLSYNCFIALDKTLAAAIAGGARRRAYESLSRRVGTSLSAVFMQSQDGGTYFRSKSDG